MASTSDIEGSTLREPNLMRQKASSLYTYFFQHSFMRYLFIGGSTFAIDFGLLVTVHDALGINLLIAASISYWTSILFNFTMNRLWTFGNTSANNLHKHLALYLVLLGFNYLFTIGFIGFGTHMGMNYMLAKILAVIIQVPWTYIAYKKVVFAA